MSLDVFQQVFHLSLASNLVSNFRGTQTDLQKALQGYLSHSLPGPEWQVVWGPVVWKHLDPENPDTGPDNSWYIAHHPALEFEDGSVHPTYVIAIAGTPPESEYAWTEQNFAVDRVVDFHSWVASGIQTLPVAVESVVPGIPYIAFGTVNAVHFLLTTPAPEGAMSPAVTLLDFITSCPPDHAKFITTGHSLGASPGNSAFTELFVSIFPSTPRGGTDDYRAWNLNLVNTLDIVPQAWGVKAVSPEQNIGNIPPIYGIPALQEVNGVAVLLTAHALKSRAYYLPLHSQFFTGTPPSKVPETLEEYLEIALREHGHAYYDLLGVRLPPSTLSGNGITEKSEAEKRYNSPIIAGFEWARRHPKETEKEVKKVKDSEDAKQVLDQI